MRLEVQTAVISSLVRMSKGFYMEPEQISSLGRDARALQERGAAALTDVHGGQTSRARDVLKAEGTRY